MDIEIERGIAVQEGRPGRAIIRMIGNDGDVKAVVVVSALFTDKQDDDTFHIEVFSGHTTLHRPVDIRLDI